MSDLPLTAPSETQPQSAPAAANERAAGEVLYRKWRPQSFAEVHGHEAITRTLRNSVASGRLAHAYLFCGPRGTGKTTLGRLLAKAANCEKPNDGEPCNDCHSCRDFNAGRAMDFVELDAASHNSVDDIRQLRENVVLTPMGGKRKVYLLDEVHMLSRGAENALLKTLEEPPPHIIFVLATTEAHKVSPTIISRCQRFDLKRIPLAAMVERLNYICEQEGFEIDAESLDEVARAATGSLRDAVNSLEQVATYYGKSPTPEQVRDALGLSVDARSGQLAKAALQGDLGAGLGIIAQVRDDGAEMKQFAKQVVRYLRGLLLAKAGAADSLDLPAEIAAEVRAEAAGISKDAIIRCLQAFGRADFRDDPSSAGGSLPLELALIDVAGGEPPVAAAPGREPTTAPKQQPATARPAAKAEEPYPTPESTPEPERPTQVREPAPGPAAIPAPRPHAAASSDNLIERVREACKDTEKQLAALLNGSCEVLSEEGDTVVLGFFHTFHLERVEDGAFDKALDEVFSNVLGRSVHVKCEHAPREREERPKGGHLVKAAQELGARAITPDDSEGGADA